MYGVKCNPHGRIEAGKPYEKYNIITQYEVGEWVSVNGVVEPSAYLVEGETETIGKELLRREGELSMNSAYSIHLDCFDRYCS